MEAPVVQLENTLAPFSNFPQKMNDYFAKNNVVIKVVPVDLDRSFEPVCQDFQVTSADQYHAYLQSELEFWQTADPDKKLNTIVQHDRLKNALDHFNTAKRHCETSSESQMTNSLRSSQNALTNGILTSKSNLASFILRYVDATPDFITGLKYGLSASKTSSPRNVAEINGVIIALSYTRGEELQFQGAAEAVEQLVASITIANNNYSTLNAKYSASFEEQEQKLHSITDQTNEHFASLAEQTEAQNKSVLSRLSELESLYEEKLKLQAPAQYWADMEKSYTKSGRWWLVSSVGLSALLMGGLFYFAFKLLPADLGLEENWTYIFKLSAMLAVITSVGVYILRLLVKMATSSFHLARDAKERNRLSYFYLALIEKKAITDKERAIVLNSLFSRADTGLLKGDSSPVMSSNVTDLVDSMTKK